MVSLTPKTPPGSLFDAVGGMPFFSTLVDRFYEGVETDARLRPMYPSDLTEARHHMTLFLAQYWGGPTTYNEQRGHPRLRMRHFPFAIGPTERDAWLEHMTAAVRHAELPVELEQTMLQYFAKAAEHLVNQPG